MWHRAAWSALHAPAFRILLFVFCGAEGRARPGATRNHWRRVRRSAINYYEAKFGIVPSSLKAQHLNLDAAFYDSQEYKVWSQSGYGV
jgi:hypothetical protein